MRRVAHVFTQLIYYQFLDRPQYYPFKVDMSNFLYSSDSSSTEDVLQKYKNKMESAFGGNCFRVKEERAKYSFEMEDEAANYFAFFLVPMALHASLDEVQLLVDVVCPPLYHRTVYNALLDYLDHFVCSLPPKEPLDPVVSKIINLDANNANIKLSSDFIDFVKKLGPKEPKRLPAHAMPVVDEDANILLSALGTYECGAGVEPSPAVLANTLSHALTNLQKLPMSSESELKKLQSILNDPSRNVSDSNTIVDLLEQVRIYLSETRRMRSALLENQRLEVASLFLTAILARVPHDDRDTYIGIVCPPDYVREVLKHVQNIVNKYVCQRPISFANVETVLDEVLQFNHNVSPNPHMQAKLKALIMPPPEMKQVQLLPKNEEQQKVFRYPEVPPSSPIQVPLPVAEQVQQTPKKEEQKKASRFPSLKRGFGIISQKLSKSPQPKKPNADPSNEPPPNTENVSMINKGEDPKVMIRDSEHVQGQKSLPPPPPPMAAQLLQEMSVSPILNRTTESRPPFPAKSQIQPLQAPAGAPLNRPPSLLDLPSTAPQRQPPNVNGTDVTKPQAQSQHPFFPMAPLNVPQQAVNRTSPPQQTYFQQQQQGRPVGTTVQQTSGAYPAAANHMWPQHVGNDLHNIGYPQMQQQQPQHFYPRQPQQQQVFHQPAGYAQQ